MNLWTGAYRKDDVVDVCVCDVQSMNMIIEIAITIMLYLPLCRMFE